MTWGGDRRTLPAARATPHDPWTRPAVLAVPHDRSTRPAAPTTHHRRTWLAAPAAPTAHNGRRTGCDRPVVPITPIRRCGRSGRAVPRPIGLPVRPPATCPRRVSSAARTLPPGRRRAARPPAPKRVGPAPDHGVRPPARRATTSHPPAVDVQFRPACHRPPTSRACRRRAVSHRRAGRRAPASLCPAGLQRPRRPVGPERRRWPGAPGQRRRRGLPGRRGNRKPQCRDRRAAPSSRTTCHREWHAPARRRSRRGRDGRASFRPYLLRGRGAATGHRCRRGRRPPAAVRALRVVPTEHPPVAPAGPVARHRAPTGAAFAPRSGWRVGPPRHHVTRRVRNPPAPLRYPRRRGSVSPRRWPGPPRLSRRWDRPCSDPGRSRRYGDPPTPNAGTPTDRWTTGRTPVANCATRVAVTNACA